MNVFAKSAAFRGRITSAAAPRSRRAPVLAVVVRTACAIAALATTGRAWAQRFVAQWNSQDGQAGMFMAPTGMAVDTVGGVRVLYVCDETGGRILKFDAETGARIGAFGHVGTGDGEFNRPYGIAIDPATHDLYITERDNGRVQRVTSAGAFVMKWGAPGGIGSPQGNFNNPIGIAADESDLPIADGDEVIDHFPDRLGVRETDDMADRLLGQVPGFDDRNASVGEELTGARRMLAAGHHNRFRFATQELLDQPLAVAVAGRHHVIDRIANFRQQLVRLIRLTIVRSPGQVFALDLDCRPESSSIDVSERYPFPLLRSPVILTAAPLS